MTLPVRLHDAAGVRALEARALAAPGADGGGLMRRAAAAALDALRAAWPAARGIVVLCGGGNNGGDGWTLARLAREAGLAPRVWWSTPPEALRGEAAEAAREAIAAGVPQGPWTAGAAERSLAGSDVVVDALLGIGLAAPVRAPTGAIIEAVNAAGRPVLALDLPSGLCAETGRVQGVAVRADVTVTFIALKAGLWLGAGPDHAGEVRLATLGVVDDVGSSAWQRLDASQVRAALPPRARTAHKGQGGHVLVVGGGEGMPGAARLAGEAALRVGAGRVTVACAASCATAVAAGRPELMVQSLPAVPDEAAVRLRALIAASDALVVGPGLGRCAWARALVAAALGDTADGFAASRPAVFDADALHALGVLSGGAAERAGQPAVPSAPSSSTLRVYTPHPGEAARLLGLDAASVQADRPAALRALLQRLGGVVVLKGAGTLLAQAGRVPAVCGRGHPVLAAPGTGDVLAGAIAGLLAQSVDAWDAACAAVWLHARAGERLANAASRGVLAGEVAAELPAALSEAVAGGPDDCEGCRR
jgi:NAD(P)H-hydrate epimerase